MNDRADWLEWRRHGIGASDIAKLLGLSTHGTPWTVWADKVGLRPDQPASDRLQLGLDLEDFIGSQFTKQTGLHVAGQQMPCINQSEPWMRCTVDAFAFEHDVFNPATPDELLAALGPVQYKTDARYGPFKTIPDDMMAQCQWEMAVTGHTHSWLVVFHGNMRIDVYPVERNPSDVAFMTDQARRFWQGHVLTGTPPAMTGTPAELDALHDIYPTTTEGATVELDPSDVAEWRMRRDVRLDAEKRENAAKAAILAAVGDAELGTVGGVPVVTCRTITRDGYTVAPSTYRTLRDAPKG